MYYGEIIGLVIAKLALRDGSARCYWCDYTCLHFDLTSFYTTTGLHTNGANEEAAASFKRKYLKPLQ